MLLFDTNILIEVLVGCRDGEAGRVEAWLQSFSHLALEQAIARETEQRRQQQGLKVPDAIILATASCHGFTLATRSSRDLPLPLGGVVHPYSI